MMFHKKNFLISFVSLLFVSVTHAETPTNSPENPRIKNTWDKVSALYLPSLANTEKQKSAPAQLAPLKQTKQIEKSDEPEEKKHSEELQAALTPNAAHHITHVLGHLAHTEPYNANLHNEQRAIFDDTTYRDLTIFCGKEDDPTANVFSLIDQTQTIAGRTALLDMLYNPLTDIKALTDRQIALKKLVADQKLYTQLQEKNRRH